METDEQNGVREPSASEYDTVVDTAGPDSAQASVETVLRHVRERCARPLSIGERVAAGGMAEVFWAEDPSLGRRTAMKLLHTKLCQHRSGVAGFVREAHVTGQLDHPNIVPVHTLGVGDDGRPFFTMKLVEGKTFHQLVAALPPGPIARSTLLDLLGVVVKACDALAFAHSRGVIHADIKPSNLMVGGFGQVYLMDWGIARLRSQRDGPDSAGDVHSWVLARVPDGTGSPSFIPPEQAQGQEPTERSDVFGVGALVYFVLTRRPPYAAESLMEAFGKAIDGEITPLTTTAGGGRVPLLLRRIVERAMAVDLAARYPSVEAFQQDLVRFIRGGGDYPMVTFAAGQTVVRQGEQADAAYVVVAGRCEVYTDSPTGVRTTQAQLGRGDVFGETAILADSNRTASVRALEETTVVRIPLEYFERELDDMKPWMSAFTRALAQRFRDQLERADAPLAAAPRPTVDLVLYYLAIWAGEQPAGRRTIALDELSERMAHRYDLRDRDVERAIASCPYVTLSASAEHVTVTDLKRLTASLHASILR